MEQAQHFDSEYGYSKHAKLEEITLLIPFPLSLSRTVASLLNCLHQLQSENLRLEEHVTSLIARRDHLLAVNARLQIPLNNAMSNAKAEAHGK